MAQNNDQDQIQILFLYGIILPGTTHSAARMPISSQIFRCTLELGHYITF